MINAQLYRIMDFNGGLNDSTNTLAMSENNFVDMNNIDVYREGDRFVLSQSRGTVDSYTVSTGTKCTGIFTFVRESDNTVRRIICVDDKIYVLQGLSLVYLSSPGRGWTRNEYLSASAAENPIKEDIVPIIYREVVFAGSTISSPGIPSLTPRFYTYEATYNATTRMLIRNEDPTRLNYSGIATADSYGFTPLFVTGGNDARFTVKGYGDLSAYQVESTTDRKTTTIQNNENIVPFSYTAHTDLFCAVTWVDKLYLQNGSNGHIITYDGVTHGYLDNSPTKEKFLIEFENHLFVVTGNNENTLQSSALGDDNTWEGENTLTVVYEEAITGLGKIPFYLVVFLKNAIYFITGSSVADFQSVKSSSANGCISHHSIVAVENSLYYASRDGFYVTTGLAVPQKISDPTIDTLFKSIPPSYWTSIIGVNDIVNSRVIWTIYPNGNPIEVFYYYNLGIWTKWDTGYGVIGKLRNSSDQDEVYFFTSPPGNIQKGFIKHNFGGSTPINSLIRTRPLNFGSAGTKKSVWAVDIYYRVHGNYTMRLNYKSDVSDWAYKTFTLYDDRVDNKLNTNFRIDSSKLVGRDKIRKKRLTLNIPAKELTLLLQTEPSTTVNDFQIYGMDVWFKVQGEGENA